MRLKDTTLEALGRGLRYVREVFDERRKRRQPHPLESQTRMDRLSRRAWTTRASAAPTS